MGGAFEPLLRAGGVALGTGPKHSGCGSGVCDCQKDEPRGAIAGLDDPVVQGLPQIGARVRQRSRLVDRVLALPLLGRVVTPGVVEDDVVERLDADREVVLIVHALERGQQRVVDLGQVAERWAGRAERRS